MHAHHAIVLKVLQHLLFFISTRTSEGGGGGGGGGYAMSAKLAWGCVVAFKMFSMEQTTSNAANISGSIQNAVVNTQKNKLAFSVSS